MKFFSDALELRPEDQKIENQGKFLMRFKIYKRFRETFIEYYTDYLNEESEELKLKN